MLKNELIRALVIPPITVRYVYIYRESERERESIAYSNINIGNEANE
jgi:hypothetical protein